MFCFFSALREQSRVRLIGMFALKYHLYKCPFVNTDYHMLSLEEERLRERHAFC